jgi:hypothetical protein
MVAALVQGTALVGKHVLGGTSREAAGQRRAYPLPPGRGGPPEGGQAPANGTTGILGAGKRRGGEQRRHRAAGSLRGAPRRSRPKRASWTGGAAAKGGEVATMVAERRSRGSAPVAPYAGAGSTEARTFRPLPPSATTLATPMPFSPARAARRATCRSRSALWPAAGGGPAATPARPLRRRRSPRPATVRGVAPCRRPLSATAPHGRSRAGRGAPARPPRPCGTPGAGCPLRPRAGAGSRCPGC